MNEYIEKIFNVLVPENKGYSYVRTETIYIPIYKVTLSITKRKHINLNLVEEMVLKIVNCGVNDLDEIAGILGLDKDILNITIGDLYGKDLVYQTSNKCSLMIKGREALKELTTSKREKDDIRNIYVNALSQDITNEKSRYVDCKYINNDNKVHHTFDGRNIDFYRGKMSTIREIFDKENDVYTIDNNRILDELVSIDDVEDLSVCYLKMPINIYISETGTDIDIMAKDNSLNTQLENIKGIVIEQVRRHSLLKNTFRRFKIVDTIQSEGQFESPTIMQALIKKYVIDSKNQSNYFESISEKVFNNRMLIDNEFQKLCEMIFETKKKIDFYIDNLDYWSKESNFITMLSSIPLKVEYNILYNNAKNLTLAEKRFRNSIPKIGKNAITKLDNDDWFKMVVENQFQIIAIPKCYEVFEDKTYIVKTQYYLHRIDLL